MSRWIGSLVLLAMLGATELHARAVSEASVESEPLATAALARKGQEPVASAPSTKSARFELRGRFLLPDGKPAAGVELQLMGWTASDERERKFGLPSGFEAPRGASGSDGRFALRFDPPPAFQFVLTATRPGLAKVGWRWDALERNAITNVGEITMQATGSIAGRLIDPRGRAVKGSWIVYADTPPHHRSPGEDTATTMVATDSESGSFRIDDLAPGETKLRAFSKIANWIDGPTVQVRAGEVLEQNVVYNGPDNGRCIVVMPFTRPFHEFESGDWTITLRTEGGETRIARKIPESSQSWAFDDLDPGTYRVEIVDPRFRRWSRSRVSPGEFAKAYLTGNSSVRLSVEDAQTGKPIDEYRLAVRFPIGGRVSRPVDLRGRGQSAPENGVYEGLVTGDLTIEVAADGYALRETTLSDLKPEETRSVRVTLARGATIDGVVIASDGITPAQGISVVLEPDFSMPDDSKAGGSAASGSLPAAPSKRSDRMREMRTSKQGAFEFHAVPDGNYLLRATATKLVGVLATGIRIRDAKGASIAPRLPVTGNLVGHLVSASGRSFEGTSVHVYPLEWPDRNDPYLWFDGFADEPPELVAMVSASGEFRIGPLPIGEFGAFVWDARPDGGLNSYNDVHELETFRIEHSGETVREFQFGPPRYGTLRVAALVNGEPLSNVSVRLERIVPFACLVRERTVFVGETGEDGTLRRNVVASAWRLFLQETNRRWSLSSPELVQIRNGEETNLRVDLKVIQRNLQFVDEVTGAPLCDRDVQFSSYALAQAIVRTDGSGRASVRLPIGAYFVSEQSQLPDPKYASTGGTIVQWTALGPEPSIVRVLSTIPRAR